MANILEITDLNGPEVAVFARLTENQLRNRLEPEKGIFIAESEPVIRYALAAGYEPVAFLTEKRHLQQDHPVWENCGETPVYSAEREVLAQLTGYALTRGALCAFRRKPMQTLETVCRDARRLAVLEGIVDTTNIGAIFRSAAALGMDGVLLSPTCGDPLYRRSVRVSMGTVFQIPWTRFPCTAAEWPEKGIDALREMGFRTAAMALSDRAVSIEEPGLGETEKLAVFLGTEGTGLQPETIERCDDVVCIPMSHGVDSLNVAAASAVTFWQLRVR